MLITKTLKLVIVCAEFEILYIFIRNSYIYPILRLVSPEGPPWLELRGQGNFLFSNHLESQIIQSYIYKREGTLSREKYKYHKIVKIVVYVFKQTRIFRVFQKLKVKGIKVKNLCYNNFPFLEIKTLEMLNVRSSRPMFRKIFLKFSGKHLW